MASLLSCFLLLCVFATIESRTFRLKNIPITPEGISLRIIVKEDTKTGLPVASVKIAMDGKKHAKLATSTENIPSTTELKQTPTTDVHSTTELQQTTTAEPILKEIPEIDDPVEDPPSEVSFENRFGIGGVKCPKGRKRIGRVCHPLS